MTARTLPSVTLPLLWVVAIVASGCADEPATSAEPTAAGSTGTCPGGKCDGFADTVADYYSDMRSIALDDLIAVGAGLATDQLNGALSDIPYVDIQLEPTTFFGVPRELFGQTIVHDLDALHAGLTERLGEHAFATRINAMRQATIRANPETVFAESRFQIGATLSPNWAIDVGDAVGSVGFAANPGLEAVVIAPHRDLREAALRSPLSSIKAARGFILPRNLDDVRAMAPGESLALRASGGLGLSLGLGLPLHLATVAEFITLRARISAAARVSLTGTLDVQLIRGEGDDVFLDVGLEKQRLRHFELALRTGWGVEGLPEVRVELGPVSANLSDIAERALEKHLNRKLAVFSGRASSGTEANRINVARFRFDVSEGSKAIEQALSQAMKGDIRLAQALANRPGSGVIQELDFAKDARTESSYLGFRFLGMEFYRSRGFDTGTVHISTEEGDQTLLFSELERRGGFFFTHRGTTWRQVVSLLAKDGRLYDAQVNARLTLREADSFLSRDQILDHVDPLLGWFVGFEGTFDRIGAETDPLAYLVDHYCPTPDVDEDGLDVGQEEYEACVAGLGQVPEVEALVERARRSWGDAAATQLATGFDPSFASASELARRLFELKLGLATTHDRPDVGLNGPKGAIVTQVRFSSAALAEMFTEGRQDAFRQAVESVLRLMHADRDRDQLKKVDKLDSHVQRRRLQLDRMRKIYGEAIAEFGHLDRVADLAPEGGERLGDHAHLVLVPADGRLSDVELATVAEHKARVVEALYDKLVGAAGSLGEPKSFVVGYSLMWMAKPADVELMADFQFEEAPYTALGTRLYGRGTAPLIDAGQFDLDELLGAR